MKLKGSLSIPAESTFKLVENTIILIQVAKLLPEMIVDVYCLYWFVLHLDVPYL
jgi:hypothetical protein